MNTKVSLFLIWVEAIMYLLLYNLHECTFNMKFFSNYYTGLWQKVILHFSTFTLDKFPKYSGNVQN